MLKEDSVLSSKSERGVRPSLASCTSTEEEIALDDQSDDIIASQCSKIIYSTPAGEERPSNLSPGLQLAQNIRAWLADYNSELKHGAPEMQGLSWMKNREAQRELGPLFNSQILPKKRNPMHEVGMVVTSQDLKPPMDHPIYPKLDFHTSVQDTDLFTSIPKTESRPSAATAKPQLPQSSEESTKLKKDFNASLSDSMQKMFERGLENHMDKLEMSSGSLLPVDVERMWPKIAPQPWSYPHSAQFKASAISLHPSIQLNLEADLSHAGPAVLKYELLLPPALPSHFDSREAITQGIVELSQSGLGFPDELDPPPNDPTRKVVSISRDGVKGSLNEQAVLENELRLKVGKLHLLPKPSLEACSGDCKSDITELICKTTLSADRPDELKWGFSELGRARVTEIAPTRRDMPRSENGDGEKIDGKNEILLNMGLECVTADDDSAMILSAANIFSGYTSITRADKNAQRSLPALQPNVAGLIASTDVLVPQFSESSLESLGEKNGLNASDVIESTFPRQQLEPVTVRCENYFAQVRDAIRGAILSLLSRLRLQDEGQASVHIQSAIMVLSSLLETFHILGVRAVKEAWNQVKTALAQAPTLEILESFSNIGVLDDLPSLSKRDDHPIITRVLELVSQLLVMRRAGERILVNCNIQSAILLTCQWHTDNISFRYFNASSKPKSGVSLMHSATGSQNASEKADVFICTDLYQLGSRNFPIQPEYVVVVNNDGKIDKACSKFNWKEFLEKSPKQRVIIVRPNISDEDVLSSSSTPIKAVDDHDAEVCRVGKRARNFDPGQDFRQDRVSSGYVSDGMQEDQFDMPQFDFTNSPRRQRLKAANSSPKRSSLGSSFLDGSNIDEPFIFGTGDVIPSSKYNGTDSNERATNTPCENNEDILGDWIPECHGNIVEAPQLFEEKGKTMHSFDTNRGATPSAVDEWEEQVMEESRDQNLESTRPFKRDEAFGTNKPNKPLPSDKKQQQEEEAEEEVWGAGLQVLVGESLGSSRQRRAASKSKLSLNEGVQVNKSSTNGRSKLSDKTRRKGSREERDPKALDLTRPFEQPTSNSLYPALAERSSKNKATVPKTRTIESFFRDVSNHDKNLASGGNSQNRIDKKPEGDDKKRRIIEDPAEDVRTRADKSTNQDIERVATTQILTKRSGLDKHSSDLELGPLNWPSRTEACSDANPPQSLLSNSKSEVDHWRALPEERGFDRVIILSTGEQSILATRIKTLRKIYALQASDSSLHLFERDLAIDLQLDWKTCCVVVSEDKLDSASYTAMEDYISSVILRISMNYDDLVLILEASASYANALMVYSHKQAIEHNIGIQVLMSGAAQETESLIISLVKNSKQLTPLSHVNQVMEFDPTIGETFFNQFPSLNCLTSNLVLLSLVEDGTSTPSVAEILSREDLQGMFLTLTGRDLG